MAQVTFKNMKKVYEKDVVAVQDFNLEIEDKEFVVLVGPSGCGKSTTLRMAAGLEEITEGELYIGDQLVNDIAPKDRDIAMVFQNYALYPHMTVYENLAFALKLRKLKKSEIDQKVREAAEILDITELLERKPKALSGGQRQRVAIGRAIVRHPQVFLMDEPLSNLDAKLRNQMRAEIIKLRQSVHTTFIYVTHDQTEAMTLGDRIVIMKDGFIQQVGTPYEVFNHPANIFVASFIGTPQMNLFDAQLELEKERFFIRLSDMVIELPEGIQTMLKNRNMKPAAVTLGVRPEHLRITSSGKSDCLEAIVDVSEMMGSEIFLHVTACEKDCVIRVATTSLPDNKKNGLLIGEKVNVMFDGALVHIFDSETQRNVLF
jgi:multiple sugar transport system ATP-binding protein